MLRYRLQYHDAAFQDLTEIHDYIAAYAGEAIAERKLSEIEASIYRLQQLPKIGSLRDVVRPGVRAILAAGKAVVCFTVDDETRTVQIICISYAGSDWVSRIKDRL